MGEVEDTYIGIERQAKRWWWWSQEVMVDKWIYYLKTREAPIKCTAGRGSMTVGLGTYVVT